MKRPPRKAEEPILTRTLLFRVLLSALVVLLGTLYVFIKEMAHDGVVTPRDTTMTFTTFVMFDMMNALSCRAAEQSVFSLGFTSNKFFLYAVGGSLAGQLAVIYFPPLQAVFQTEPLTLKDWVFILCITSTVLIVDEIRKAVVRAKLSAPGAAGGRLGGIAVSLAASNCLRTVAGSLGLGSVRRTGHHKRVDSSSEDMPKGADRV